MTPNKLPIVLLNKLILILPLACCVNINAVLTGGGKQDTDIKPNNI